MKIFVLASRFPYPLERGDKLRLYHQIKGLGKNYSIHLYAICDQKINPDHFEEVAQYCENITLWNVSKFNKAWNAAHKIYSGLPLQASTIFDETFHKIILKDTASIKPDVIFCQLIRMAPYATGLKAYKLIDYMDAYGIGMERRSGIAKGLNKLLYKYEAKKTMDYESRIYADFDQHTVISQQDAELLKLKMDIVPNGIDLDYFSPQSHIPEFDIGFIGNMGYLPNVEAAEILSNEIQSAYRNRFGEKLQILIAGARPHARVLKLKSDSVFISGWMNDIRDAYLNTKIICAPIYSGTGQQNKVLEAMAMGIPCITTTSVNAAIGATNRKNIILADSTGQFADAINALLHDQNLYQKISVASRAFVEENFSWESSLNKLRSLLNPKQ